MQTDWDLLIIKINELRENQEISMRQIEREAGVNNLSRVLRKGAADEMAPTPELWRKLHRAYPKDIPEPTYIDGEKVYQRVTAFKVDTTGGKLIGDKGEMFLTPLELALIEAIRECENPVKTASRIIAELAES